MKRTFVLTTAILLALGCAKEKPVAAPQQAAVAPAAQRLNLLDLGRGASVVSRTGEHNLDHTAAQAIDGSAETLWSSPALDTQHTLVFALPARTRVDRVGAVTVNPQSYAPDKLVFESSLDGQTFAPLAELALKPVNNTQQGVDVKPVEMRYLRVKVICTLDQQYARLATIFVNGTELEPPHAASIDGCWSINGYPLTMVQSGSRANGVIAGTVPIDLDGGFDGRVFRFAWYQEPQSGVAVFTVSPDGEHLSGWWWHEEAHPDHRGVSWFGERRPCTPSPVDTTVIMLTFLRRERPLPLYGLRFDEKDQLMASESAPTVAALASLIAGTHNREIRLFARENRYASDENKARSERRLNALASALRKLGVDIAKVKFIPSGSEHAPVNPDTEALQRMHSVIDVVAPRQIRPAGE